LQPTSVAFSTGTPCRRAASSHCGRGYVGLKLDGMAQKDLGVDTGIFIQGLNVIIRLMMLLSNAVNASVAYDWGFV
jgi:hypothetical protein